MPIYCNPLCVVYLLCEAWETSRSYICVFICAVTECSSKCLYISVALGLLKWGVAALKFLVFFFTAKFEIWWIFRTPLKNKTTAQCKIVDPIWEDFVHVWGGAFCEGLGVGCGASSWAIFHPCTCHSLPPHPFISVTAIHSALCNSASLCWSVYPSISAHPSPFSYPSSLSTPACTEGWWDIYPLLFCHGGKPKCFQLRKIKTVFGFHCLCQHLKLILVSACYATFP